MVTLKYLKQIAKKIKFEVIQNYQRKPYKHA